MQTDHRRMRRRFVENRRQKSERDHNSEQADQQQLLPSTPVNKVNADNGAQGVETRGDEGEEERRLVRGEARELDDGGAVVHDGVYADELLENLEANPGY